MKTPLGFRWLGVAGIELRYGDQTLIIDSFSHASLSQSIGMICFGR
jgi:hypothetical protein